MKSITRKKVLIISFSALVLAQIFFAWQVFAATPTMEIPNPLDAETFEDLVRGVARWFYRVMIPVASIVILYAAFLFLTSGGDEEKVKKAKRAITYAVVGVAIILIGAGFITLIRSLLEVN